MSWQKRSSSTAILALCTVTMQLHPASHQSLRRVFQTNFSAHDITESLLTCDREAPADEVGRIMEERRLQVIGVREMGQVIGYVDREQIKPGMSELPVSSFDTDSVIFDTEPLDRVVLGLQNHPRLFVSVFGRVGGIVTRTDLQKPAARMWLFGMVTLMEMRITQLIAEEAGDRWQNSLSDARVQKARDLRVERQRRGQDVTLIDCLQFGDKVQIVARDEGLRATTRFTSRRRVEEAGKRLERLRNNLAHAQDIVTGDWDVLVELSSNLESVVLGPAWEEETGNGE